jgi:hypothetical protein
MLKGLKKSKANQEEEDVADRVREKVNANNIKSEQIHEEMDEEVNTMKTIEK